MADLEWEQSLEKGSSSGPLLGVVKKPKARSWEEIQESSLPFVYLLKDLYLEENSTKKDNWNPLECSWKPWEMGPPRA